MKKLYYPYSSFIQDTKSLAILSNAFNPDALLGIARGGLTLSHFMAQFLEIRNLYTLTSIHYDNEKKLDTFDIFNIPDLSKFKKVLIVDDIVDSGETISKILIILNKKFPNIQFKVASLFYKSTAVIQPDFYINETTDWIEFFWEVDVQ